MVPVNPIFDALYCNEEQFDDDLTSIDDFNVVKQVKTVPLLFSEQDLFWEDEEIVNLLSKEVSFLSCDGSLEMVRNDGIKWMLKVVAHYGFNSLTAFLAVYYYDRFMSSEFYQRDKGWMSQLAAVACVSIAAKVEETQVPLLLDFQVEEAKYVFEAKTIMRMEIMVLTALKWKMNPVTPISFFDHFVRRFGLTTEFLRKCESVVLAMINDCKLGNYLPSVIAAATMVYVIREIEHCDALDMETQVMSLLQASKEKVADCLKLIVEEIDDGSRKNHRKRKHDSMPSSPNGVIEAYFSSESSNESWSVASSVSSSPEPVFKKHSLASESSIHWCG